MIVTYVCTNDDCPGLSFYRACRTIGPGESLHDRQLGEVAYGPEERSPVTWAVSVPPNANHPGTMYDPDQQLCPACGEEGTPE